MSSLSFFIFIVSVSLGLDKRDSSTPLPNLHLIMFKLPPQPHNLRAHLTIPPQINFSITTCTSSFLTINLLMYTCHFYVSTSR
jgi:hypothetical protein